MRIVVHSATRHNLHLARKYARIFVRGHYLFREANSFPRAQLEENCELRGTDNVQGQISEHLFTPNGGYRVYYPSNLFRNARSFGNWGIFNNYSMSPRWIWSDKVTNERVARVGYSHFLLFNFHTLYEFRFSDWLICTMWHWVMTQQPPWRHYRGVIAVV